MPIATKMHTTNNKVNAVNDPKTAMDEDRLLASAVDIASTANVSL